MTLSIFIDICSALQLHIDLIANDFDIEHLISFKINVSIAINFLMEIGVLHEILRTDNGKFISR